MAFTAVGFRQNQHNYIAVGNYLEKEKIKFKTDQHLSKEGEQITFDFFLPDYNCYIETTGEKATLKRRLSAQNNFHLIEIDSNTNFFNQIEMYLKYITKEGPLPLKGIDY